MSHKKNWKKNECLQWSSTTNVIFRKLKTKKINYTLYTSKLFIFRNRNQAKSITMESHITPEKLSAVLCAQKRASGKMAFLCSAGIFRLESMHPDRISLFQPRRVGDANGLQFSRGSKFNVFLAKDRYKYYQFPNQTHQTEPMHDRWQKAELE